MNSLKQNIINEFEKRTNYLLNDCNSFLYLKCIPSVTDNECAENNIGGGNFLMAIGLFSLVNLAAKINYAIDGNEHFTKEEIGEIVKVKKMLIDSSESNKKIISARFIVPKINTLKTPENKCFEKLFLDTKDIVTWGIELADCQNIWDYYRNKLSHLSIPGGAIAANGNNVTGINYKILHNVYSNPSRKIFISSNGHYVLDVDKLSGQFPVIKEWLKDKINNVDNKTILEKIRNIID